MKREATLHCMLLTGLLVLTLIACQASQNEPSGDSNNLPSGDILRFFVHAEHDLVTRVTRPTDELSVSSPVAYIESVTRYSIIKPSREALERRYPERVWGYGDITPFHLAEVTYDATRRVATSVYASGKWSPYAGTMVCTYDDDRELVLEDSWLTSFDYLCECCVLVLIRQMRLEDVSPQGDAYWIGASATVEPVPIGDGRGEFVAGYWAIVEHAEESNASTQTLHWIEGDEHWTLRWRACDWLFEIRAKGQDQDAGFVFEDLVFIAQDIHDQVACD